MINSDSTLRCLGNADLLASTRQVLRRACVVEADLLLHLIEIEERRLHNEMAFPTMFAFCVGELGFSEDQAYNRTTVARVAKELPAILEALRSGAVHLTGLRLLAPHLKEHNHRELLAQANGKSKREIEEMVAALAPKPPVPASFRKTPRANPATMEMALEAPAQPAVRRVDRAVIAPLGEDTFKVQFTGSRALRDKFRRAQDLLRHRVPSGDVATVFETALDALIEKVEKERFAAAAKPRSEASAPSGPASSRHVPARIRRHVYSRDGGRCTFTDERGNRCQETGMLEFDHLDGFSRTGCHDPDRIVLRCRAHNQYAAEKMYGREFMERARAASATRAESTSQQPLFAGAV